MDEERARNLLHLAAPTEAPPARVDIGLACRRGRKRLRRRRAGQASAPAVAAVAVVAVILGPAAPLRSGGYAAAGRTAAPASGRVTPPRQFNPLIPYAAFGWLPRGASLNGGQIAPAYVYLTAGRSASYALTAFAAGRCNLTSQQVLRRLRQHQAADLNCTQSSSGGYELTVTSTAPRVDGHLAFWTRGRGYLAWEYARGSWAILSGPSGRAAIRDTAKIADHVRYDVATRPSIEFPAQLTGLAAATRVGFTYFVSDAGVPRASQYTLTGGGPGAPDLTTDPAPAHSTCYFYPGQSERATINGYRVVVNHLKGKHGDPPVQQVCAARADGLAVFISTYGKNPKPSAISIFAHHLRLLGTDPAHWTTQPLS